MKKYLSLVALSLALSLPVYGQSGVLDVSFGTDGIVLYQEVLKTTIAHDLLFMPDSSIITIGETYDGFGSQLLMIGFQADGAINPNFGGHGLFNEPTWGGPGKVATDLPGSNREYAYAADLQSDGKFVVAGYGKTDFDWLVARYQPNGYLDSSFAQVGYFFQDQGGFDQALDIEVLGDQKILVSGYGGGHLIVARYLANGTPDPQFGVNGVAALNSVSAYGGRMAIDNQGRIYLCGINTSANTQLICARFLDNGSPDNSFGASGYITVSHGTQASEVFVSVLYNGRVLLVSDGQDISGFYSSLNMARITENGSLDTDFDTDGKLVLNPGDYATPNGLMVASDGKIIVGGRIVRSGIADLFIAKYSENGAPEAGFGTNGVAVSGLGVDLTNTYAAGYSVAIQPDGNIIAGGTYRTNGLNNMLVARFTNTMGFPAALEYQPTAHHGFSLYPNPATTSLWLNLREGTWNAVRLLDVLGREVKRYALTAADRQLEISLTGLEPGVYLLVLSGNQGSAATRFVKQQE